MKLKITPIGNSFGLILPKETLAKLKVTGGDAVFITETPGGFRITPYDREFEAQMNAAKGVMKKLAMPFENWQNDLGWFDNSSCHS